MASEFTREEIVASEKALIDIYEMSTAEFFDAYMTGKLDPSMRPSDISEWLMLRETLRSFEAELLLTRRYPSSVETVVAADPVAASELAIAA